MGWVSVLIGLAASGLLYRADSIWLFGITLAVTAANLWSYGVMHNFAVESAKRKGGYTGGFYDLTERDVLAPPNWLATINMLTAAALAGLLVTAIIFTL